MVTDIGAPVLIDIGATVDLAQMRDKDTGAKVETLDTMRSQITKAPTVAPVTRKDLSTAGAPTSVHEAQNIIAIGALEMIEI
jgi:hypothetical protein